MKRLHRARGMPLDVDGSKRQEQLVRLVLEHPDVAVRGRGDPGNLCVCGLAATALHELYSSTACGNAKLDPIQAGWHWPLGQYLASGSAPYGGHHGPRK